jgi:UPF0042 nucleotide-binding protein
MVDNLMADDRSPATPSVTAPARLIIVTGVSGSGRASALRVMEDLGLYCVDNLPVALAPEVLRLASENDPSLKGVALGVDARERTFFPQWPAVLADLEAQGIHPEVVFLDASDEVLARRYSESRRPHPLAESGLSVAESIQRERVALSEMRERAGRIIDTTTLTVHELREIVTAFVMGAGARDGLAVTLVSFGYKYGLPVGLDLVLDARFIPNPFFVKELRDLDGLDPRVRDYVMGKEEARGFIERVAELLAFLLPLYRREGKSYVRIGIGCTGGRHRSPALVEELRRRLDGGEVRIEADHHDIER